MSLDFADAVTRGLHDYARSVARALGVEDGGGWSVRAEPPVEIYVALDVRLSSFPDRDVALLWGEAEGWSVAVETGSGEDLILVGSYPGEPRPAPRAVGEWALEVFAAGPLGEVRPLFPRKVDGGDQDARAFEDSLPEPRSA